MSTIYELRESDSKGRISLPRQFANSTLMLEVVNDVELVIRKAKVVPLDSGGELPPFSSLQPLSNSDRDLFLKMLDDPTPPNDALKRAMAAAKQSGT